MLWRMPTRALRLTHVSKRYGGVVAVKDISFEAKRGEVHALLGENGAGKSTLMGIASGVVRPGRRLRRDLRRDDRKARPAQAQHLGLAIVHQHPAVLPELTVAENMLLAIPASLRRGGGAEWVAAQLRQVGSTVDPRTRMSEVDIAQRQLYELAKALAIEPEGADPRRADRGAHRRPCRAPFRESQGGRGSRRGRHLHLAPPSGDPSDRGSGHRDAGRRDQGRVARRRISDDEILRLIVGRTFSHAYPPKAETPKTGPVGLSVTGLTGENFYDVSMSARGGEIVGIAGITGNGQSEFLRALAGLVVRKRSRDAFREAYRPRPPRRRPKGRG